MSINNRKDSFEEILKFFNNYWPIPKDFGNIIGISITVKSKESKILEVFKIKNIGDKLYTSWNEEFNYDVIDLVITRKQIAIEDYSGIRILITIDKQKNKMILTLMNDLIDYDIKDIEYVFEKQDLQNVIVHDNISVWHRAFFNDYNEPKKSSIYSYSIPTNASIFDIHEDIDEEDHKKPKTPFWKK